MNVNQRTEGKQSFSFVSLRKAVFHDTICRAKGGEGLKKRTIAALLSVCALLFSFPGHSFSFSGQETALPLPSASPLPPAFTVPPVQDEAEETEELLPAISSLEDLTSAYIPNPEWERKFTNYYNATSSKTGVFIVTLKGKPLLIWIRGNRDTRKNPTELTTAFKIASVTKMVTAIGFMQLAEQGIIGLDDPINSYLPFRVVNPACPEAEITMR